MNRRIGHTGLPVNYLARLWAAALLAAGVGWGVRVLMGHHSPVLMAIVVLGPYGVSYFGLTLAMGIEESRALFSRIHL